MALYDVHHLTDDVVRLTDVSMKFCERVLDAVQLLAMIADPAAAKAAPKTRELNGQLEWHACRIMRRATSELSREEPDLRELIKP